MTPEIISGVVVAGFGLLGFLIRSWVESIRNDLASHMQEEAEIRRLEAKMLDNFRCDVKNELTEIRTDIRYIHNRIDSIFEQVRGR